CPLAARVAFRRLRCALYTTRRLREFRIEKVGARKSKWRRIAAPEGDYEEILYSQYHFLRAGSFALDRIAVPRRSDTVDCPDGQPLARNRQPGSVFKTAPVADDLDRLQHGCGRRDRSRLAGLRASRPHRKPGLLISR